MHENLLKNGLVVQIVEKWLATANHLQKHIKKQLKQWSVHSELLYEVIMVNESEVMPMLESI